MKKNTPPTLPLRFFRWFCHTKLRDSIEGDLAIDRKPLWLKDALRLG